MANTADQQALEAREAELQTLAELHRNGAQVFQSALDQLTTLAAQLATANTPPDTRTLDERMAAVQLELEDVPRRGHAEIKGKTKAGADYTYTYDYILEADLMSGVRPLLAKHGIAVYYSDEILSNQNGTATVRVSITFSANGEQRIVTGEALGVDTGDKGPNKAKTSATRYLLWKTFLQPSDEDPEQENVSQELAAGAHLGRQAQHEQRQPNRRGSKTPEQMHGELIQRIVMLALELDEVQGKAGGTTQAKLYEDVRETAGISLPDLDNGALVEIGKKLAGHVGAQREIAEKGGEAVESFEIPTIA
jgi:hypothetical protein